MVSRGNRFLEIFLDFIYLTTGFGLATEFYDQKRNGVFLYLHALCGNEFMGPKKRKRKTQKFFSIRLIWV
jgi:hypothetical protein